MRLPFVSRKRYERVLQEHDEDLWMLMKCRSFVSDLLLTGNTPTERHCRDTQRQIEGYLERPAVRETEVERQDLRLKRAGFKRAWESRAEHRT